MEGSQAESEAAAMTRVVKITAASTVLLALILVLIVVIFPDVYYYHVGSGDCRVCFLRTNYRVLKLCGITVRDRTRPHYSTLPELQALQKSCTHPDTVGRGRSGNLFVTEIGCGPSPSAQSLVRIAELPKGMGAAISLVVWSNEHALREPNEYTQRDADEALWFVQQATGRAFGITYDIANSRPIVPEDTFQRILDWWEDEGHRKHGGTISN
jgi:hypothetical protein